MCRPLCAFPVWIDNVFLQSCFLAALLSYILVYPQGFPHSAHRNAAPAAWSICGAKCIPVQHLWVLQADTPPLPMQEPPDRTQRTQLFITLVWREPALSPECLHWEPGVQSCCDFTVRTGVAKDQSKGQVASQQLFVISITFLPFSIPQYYA